MHCVAGPAVVFPYFSLDRGGKSGVLRVALSSAKTRAMLQRTMAPIPTPNLHGKLALRIKSIRAGAKLTVRETALDGPRVVSWKGFPSRAVTAPARSNQEPVAAGA